MTLFILKRQEVLCASVMLGTQEIIISLLTMYILISHALCNASHSCDIQLYSIVHCSIIVTLFIVNCSLIIISTIGVNISIKKRAALL